MDQIEYGSVFKAAVMGLVLPAAIVVGSCYMQDRKGEAISVNPVATQESNQPAPGL